MTILSKHGEMSADALAALCGVRVQILLWAMNGKTKYFRVSVAPVELGLATRKTRRRHPEPRSRSRRKTTTWYAITPAGRESLALIPLARLRGVVQSN